jgi:hypothetical protein
MMFLDCPAYLDHERTVRCGLPAEVRCRFTMRSTNGPMESATSHHATQTVAGGGKQTPSRHGGPLTGTGAEPAYVPPATTSWPVMGVQ